MDNSVSIVLCGEAGQGIATTERLLTRILKLSGYYVFATKEYMSRVRGGVNSTSIRVSSKSVSAFVDQIDVLIPLSNGRTNHLNSRISPETFVLEKLGSNIEAIGVVCGLFSVDMQIINNYLRAYFEKKGEKIIADNIKAAEKGYKAGKELPIKFDIEKDKQAADQIICNGAEAVGLGAIAGGCNFISAYPMSPSTGVLVFLAQQEHDFGIAVEQAEDEISAINMSLGAWYAGARALVSTSGGGFALMEEGLSLCGMIESPLVVHLGQRPGPATGLPTRTEQGDLNLARYAGHGDFPRIIFAPGNILEAFSLTQKAFNLADKHQAPVFVLTDQYLMDTYYNVEELPLSGNGEPRIVKSDKEYKRYRLTPDGVSPRAIPGFGQGLVCADSDEHDENGHITEDLELRNKMVEKRMRKMDGILEDAIAPELIGSQNYKTLIIGWGSTKEMIHEAIQKLNTKDLAYLHFKQVYPVPKETLNYLTKAKKIILIENNTAGQFGDLIKLATGFEIKQKVLKYNGLPFSVEEILGALKNG